MNTRSNKVKELNREILKPLNLSEVCKVSNASKEIMLDRFCNGEEIEFPFHNY